MIISKDLAKSHVQGTLPVLLRVRLQLQPRPLLDRLVVHRLQRLARVEPSEDDLVDLVPDCLRARTEAAKGRQLVHLARVLHKLLVCQSRAVLYSVGGDGVDEVRDRIVGPVQHLHDVDKLEEDHQLHCDRRVVLRPHLPHVVVELVGDDPQKLELEHVLHLGRLVVRVSPVPRELVDPFVRFWDVSGWTI